MYLSEGSSLVLAVATIKLSDIMVPSICKGRAQSMSDVRAFYACIECSCCIDYEHSEQSLALALSRISI